jgi:hypothetical protein
MEAILTSIISLVIQFLLSAILQEILTALGLGTAV